MQITLDISKLEPVLAQDLAEIAAQRSRPLSLDEVLELREAAEGCRRAYRGEGAEATDQSGLLDRAVRVGSVTLRLPTIAGRIALRKLLAWVREGWSPDQEIIEILNAYVLAHSYDADAMALLVSPEDAERLVLEWASQLTCTRHELRAASDRLLQGAYPPAEAGGQKKKPESITPVCSPPSTMAAPARPDTGCTRSARHTSVGSSGPGTPAGGPPRPQPHAPPGDSPRRSTMDACGQSGNMTNAETAC